MSANLVLAFNHQLTSLSATPTSASPSVSRPGEPGTREVRTLGDRVVGRLVGAVVSARRDLDDAGQLRIDQVVVDWRSVDVAGALLAVVKGVGIVGRLEAMLSCSKRQQQRTAGAAPMHLDRKTDGSLRQSLDRLSPTCVGLFGPELTRLRFAGHSHSRLAQN